MEIVIDRADQIDTLQYRVALHEILPKDQIRLFVQVRALVATAIEEPQGTFITRIHAALEDFAASKWTLAELDVRPDETEGYERVTVSAWTTLRAEDNHNLEQRARAASRPGLTLAEPAVQPTLSRDKVAETVSRLSERILRQVSEQAAHYSQLTQRSWRIGHIEFGARDESSDRNRPRSLKGAYRQDETDPFQLPEDFSLTGAERISVVANVVLKAPVAR